MRRITLILAACAFLVAALWPAASAANHTLRHRVAALEAKMNCLKRTGATTLVGYAWYEGNTAPFPVHDPATDLLSDTNWAVNFNQTGIAGAPDYWLIALRNTARCRARFGVVANPYSARVARVMSLQRLSRVK